MKKTTLTKTIALAILLATFTTASASFGGDEHCKSKCCKYKKNKELAVTVAELEKAMNKLETELKTISAMVHAEVSRSLNRSIPATKSRVRVFAYSSSAVVSPEHPVAVDAKYKIDFNDLGREMDRVQQDMTSSPVSQDIDFTNLPKEMDEVQERMSSFDPQKL